MRAYRVFETTGPDGIKPVDLPDPAVGDRQILVKTKAVSLNYRDLSISVGKYPFGVKPNVIPASDGAGEVVAVGKAVKQFKPGDRVAGCFFENWSGGEIRPEVHHTSRGGAIDGMLAELVATDENGVVRIPDRLSYSEAATLPCAALTAWNALVEHARIVAGQTVLVQGTGGVSMFALQFAKAMGASVIATSSSDEKLERARKMGATHLINYKQNPDWDKAVMEITGGRGVDHVVEVGGAGTFDRSLKSVRLGGKVSVIGVLSGPGTGNPALILVKSANIQGIFVGSRQMFEAMNRAISANDIKPAIDKEFPFADATAAYKHLQSGAHFGKVVIGF